MKHSSRRGARPTQRTSSGRLVQFESVEQRLLMAVSPTTEPIRAAILRAADTSQYAPAVLRETREWATVISKKTNLKTLRTNLGANAITASGVLSDTYIVSFPKTLTGEDISRRLAQFNGGQFAWPLVKRQQTARFIPNDPRFPQQWHLQNTGQSGGLVGFDANVVSAWDNYKGDGVMLGIVDDGVTPLHEDLAPNYVAAHSFDFNNNDPDPSGGSHGSSVAGVAGGKGNNSLGISGAAPNAQHAGLRLIAGPSSDSQEANALGYHIQDIDIYNNSWGPNDGGSTLEGPGPLTLAAFADALANGRGGLGNIYVWAAGNGGDGDNVNFDGYANHRGIIAVGGITNTGVRSSFSERGASLLVTAHTAGGTIGINTTTGTAPSGYTTSFGGTSSASPLAAGVIALMLDANPNLSWRDVQHILVNSAEKVNPTQSDWTVNGAGHDVNHYFGFGGIDAAAAVALAETWTTVAPETSATTGVINVNQAIPDGNATGITSQFTVTDAIKLETVEIVFNALHASRGQLRILLTSPSGTVSEITTTRADTGDNYANWTFTTKRNWDEDARGTWTLQVIDPTTGTAGTLQNWKMNLYGSQLATTPTVYGTVYDDANANNTRDAGELGLPNVQVWDDLDNDGNVDAGEPTTTSTGSGTYALADLALGNHTVRAVTPAGLRAGQGSTSYSVNLTEGQNFSTGNNFGFINARIAGTVVNDLNDNGVADGGEGGLAGVTVYLDSNNNGSPDGGEPSQVTPASGAYEFGTLADGSYVVRAVTPSGRRLTSPGGGGAHSATIGVGSLVHSGKLFTMTDRVRIAGAIYLDKNGNGVKDPGETPMNNVRVYQDLNNNQTWDNTGGTFVSTDVPKPVPDPGTVDSILNVANVGNISNLTVKINISTTWAADLDIFLVSPSGTIVELSTDNGGSADNYIDTIFDDNAATSITTGVAPFTGTFRPEQALSTLNGQPGAGQWKLRVTDDLSSFPGTINGWSITMGSTEPNQVSDAAGNYAFAGLNPGTYALREVVPANHVLTNPTSGGQSFNAVGGELLDAAWANFPTQYTGSNITVRTNAAGDRINVWVDEPTSGAPTYEANLAIIPSISLIGTSGNDVFTIDAINSNPLATLSATIDGLGNTATGDVYAINGKSGIADNVTFNGNTANINGGTVTVTNVERARFDGRGGADTLTVVGGARVEIGNTQHLDVLDTGGVGSLLSVDAGSNAVIVVKHLLLSGLMDLNDNEMILDHPAGPSPTDVEALINAGRNGGTWDGTTGLTSTSAKNRSPRNTTLGSMDATDYKSVYGPTATFAGESIDNSAVLIKYTYYGDADFNGQVNFDDYSRTDAGFNANRSGWLNGDYDGNGVVNFDDYSLIDLAFNTQLGVL